MSPDDRRGGCCVLYMLAWICVCIAISAGLWFLVTKVFGA